MRHPDESEHVAVLKMLTAGLVQQITQPVAVIFNRLEAMLMEAGTREVPGETLKDLQVIHRHAETLVRIARGFLAFAVQPPGMQAPVDLNAVVDESVRVVQGRMAREGIRIVTALSRRLPPLAGDAPALAQVILNLFSPARSAVAGEGEVRIETGRVQGQPGRIRLVLTDISWVIPEKDLERIFDPLYATKSGGTGLGLFLSSQIVRNHQGTIEVRSKPGRGTTFTLTFPALKKTRVWRQSFGRATASIPRTSSSETGEKST